MSAISDLLKRDILNRMASHTITETQVGGSWLVELKDGTSALIASRQSPSLEDAMWNIRVRFVGGQNVLPRLNQTQIDSLSSIPVSTRIINETAGDEIETYNGTEWIRPGGSGSHRSVSYGEMYQDDDTGKDIDTTNKTWVTATQGIMDGNGCVTFEDNAAGDRLVIQPNGDGTYVVHFSANFTISTNKEVTATIRKNGTAVSRLKDSIQGSAVKKEGLRIAGFIDLADNDYLDVHMVSETPSDTVVVYQVNIHIYRVD